MSKNTAIPSQSKQVPSNTSTYHYKAAASTNLVTIRNAPTKLVGGRVDNLVATVSYLKLYDKATDPVLANDIPVMVLRLPASGSIDLINVIGDTGLSFKNGLAMSINRATADNGTTATVALDVFVNFILAD